MALRTLGWLVLTLWLGGCAASSSGVGGAGTGSGTGGSSACGSGLTTCSGSCVNPTTDAANCGACGHACAAGSACVNGACACQSGTTDCAGTCVDTTTDPTHCGGCGTVCQSGQTCISASCSCLAGLTACGSACVDLLSDGANCGVCSRACAAPQVCSGGTCATQCAGTLTQCDQSCVDPNTNTQHCGNCSTVCPTGQSCSAGACTCPSGLTACSGTCVDLQTDAAYCGSCTTSCSGGQTCSAANCSCPNGGTLCGSSCTSLQSDGANCGSCGRACSGGATCSSGTCIGGTGGTGGSGTGGSGGTGGSTGGSGGTGGSTGGTGGTTGGSGGTGGTTGGSGGTGGSTGGTGTGGTGGGTCGSINANPFNCKFAWGAASNGSNTSYLDFVSTWIGDETNGGLNSWSATGTNSSCGDCNLVQTVAGTNSMVVFYSYFIGFQACKQGGFCDCNTDTGPNLCSNGAQWIRNNRAQLVRAYGEYARVVHQRSPNKPVIWWLEGDFIQYSYAAQVTPLSYAELGALARDITCAIKSNEPNAVVAMNHSPWVSDDQFNGFWGAMPMDVIDLVWVQGPGDSGTLTNSWGQATANFTSLHTKTGRPIMAETSFGTPDRWTTTTATNIDNRINEGVIGVHINTTPSNFQSTITTLRSQIGSTCK